MANAATRVEHEFVAFILDQYLHKPESDIHPGYSGDKSCADSFGIAVDDMTMALQFMAGFALHSVSVEDGPGRTSEKEAFDLASAARFVSFGNRVMMYFPGFILT